MSPREEIQKRLVAFLEKRSGFYNAPYGILSGLEPLRGGGKVRSITFGICRILDASIVIFSPSNIRIEGRGPYAYKVEGEFKSVEEVEKHLTPA